MDEPIIATDQNGDVVEVVVANGGDITLHWSDGYEIRLTSEQSLGFAKAAMKAHKAGKELIIRIGDWVH